LITPKNEIQKPTVKPGWFKLRILGSVLTIVACGFIAYFNFVMLFPPMPPLY
jgi:hypothetical protein